MRQYGFRGKSIADEWHYGLLAQSAGFPGQPTAGMYISNLVGAPYAYQVVPKSVGEYTGFADKDRVKIYENDIVKVDTTGINSKVDIRIGLIKSIDGCFTVEFTNPIYDPILGCNRHRLYVKCFTVNHAIKVIGNIYDNHELPSQAEHHDIDYEDVYSDDKIKSLRKYKNGKLKIIFDTVEDMETVRRMLVGADDE